MWDNYKAGYNINGTLSLFPLDFNAWFNQNYTQFNKDKYFFIDSSNNINFGASCRLNLEELSLDTFFKKEYIFGKELNEEKIYAGGNILFKEYGFGLRGMIELSQLNPELWNFLLAGGKTILSDRGYLELSFGLTKDQPFFGIGFRFSPKGDNSERIIIKNNSPKHSPLIEEQGYKKPSWNFSDAIEKTDTLTKIGNVGIYFPYGRGLEDSVRNPERFFEDGYGDCDEIAWYRTYAARANGYSDSWFVGYIPKDKPSGHAFFLVKDKDGRVYVTDNDHGAWLKVDVDSNASREEMAKSAVEQLSRYMALMLPKGQDYSFLMFDEKGQIPIYYEDVSGFQSKDKGYAPIDTGLMSRIGKNPFY